MRVISIINTLDFKYGGPPVVLRNQILHINKNKKIIYTIQLKNIKWSTIFRYVFSSKKRKKIIKILSKFDIAHFHTLWSFKNIFLSKFFEISGVKYLFVGHGYLDTYSINYKNKYLKGIFLKLFLEPVFKKSSATFLSTLEEYHEAKTNIKIYYPFVIPNGIDVNRQYIKKKKDAKMKKKILYFGRLHEKKGLDFLLDVLADMDFSFLNKYYFEITGPGSLDYIAHLEKKIYNNKLSNYVKILKPITPNQKFEYIQKADYFILPSFEEGDSVALKEALSCGVPVLISDRCRMPIVAERKCGIIFQNNKKSLIKCLDNLNYIDYWKYSNNAVSLMEELYTNKTCSERLLKIYFDIKNTTYESKDWL